MIVSKLMYGCRALTWYQCNKEGMAMIGMKYDRNVWKKTFVARIQELGRRRWRNGFGINEREQQYVHMTSQPKNVWERE